MKENSTVYIVDDNITLRLRTPDEAESLFSLVDKNRNHLRPWLPWVDHTKSVDDSKNYIEEAQKKFESNLWCDFGIYYNGEMIGSAGFNKISLEKRAGEIGYWISPEHEGKGIMSKVVAAFIDIGKNNYKLHRIVITMDANNLRSKAIPKKLGFAPEGVLRDGDYINGAFINVEVWSLLL